MKFGDLIRNDGAGSKNPTKILMVVSWGKMINCLTKDGKEVTFYNDKDTLSRLTKIGRVNFEKWFQYAALELSKDD